MLTTLKTAAAAAIAVACMAVGASAATISTVNGAGGTKSAIITCTGSCAFWDLDVTDGFQANSGDWLSATYGGIPLTGPGSGNGEANRLAFVNTVVGTSFTSQSESSDSELQPDVPALGGFSDGDVAGWSGSSQYYLAWGGPDPRYILIRNDSLNNLFTWTANGSGKQSGSGLSGVDGFGELTPVPLPAAGLMLLAAIGGMAALRRRKQA